MFYPSRRLCRLPPRCRAIGANARIARHAELLTAGAAIWLTNVIAFALGYWELDRGGPAARTAGGSAHPDFLFAQMQSPELADPELQSAVALA